MKDKILEAVQISKTYGEGESAVHALKNSDLTLENGTFASIIGSSGSGKSTLLKILGGLLPPTTGKVLLDGQDIYAMNAEQLAQVRRQKIGFIFQDFRLFPEYTVQDNILTPFYLDHRAPDEQMLHKLTGILGIAGKLHSRPAQLSGGQKQRVGIARAIVSNPSVLLSDEATSALDPETVKSILQLLKDINKKLGITIVMITHQMEVIKEIAQHVAVIEHGKIIEEGSVIDLFTNPQTETLKKFVGSVMSSELPAQLSHMNIHPTKEHESDNILISLSFRGDVTNEPIIAQLIKKYNLNVSILYGSIDYIQDISFGRLLIMISGHLEDLTDALTHLNALPITSEVIGYVSRNN